MKPFINGSYIKKLFSDTKASMDEKLDSSIEKALTPSPEEKLPWERMAQVATILGVVFIVIPLLFNLLFYFIEQRYLKYFNILGTSFQLRFNKTTIQFPALFLVILFLPWLVSCLLKLFVSPFVNLKESINCFLKLNLFYLIGVLLVSLYLLCMGLAWWWAILLMALCTLLAAYQTYIHLSPDHKFSLCQVIRLIIYFFFLAVLPYFLSEGFWLKFFGLSLAQIQTTFPFKLWFYILVLVLQLMISFITFPIIRGEKLHHGTTFWVMILFPPVLFYFGCQVLLNSTFLPDELFVLSRFDQYALSYQRHTQSESDQVQIKHRYQLLLDFKAPNPSYDTLVGQKSVIIPFYDDQAYYAFPCNYKNEPRECFPESREKTPIIIQKSDVRRIRPYLEDNSVNKSPH
ncbi:MAG: hypothetical protein WDW19_05475 [Neisseriaceae bacterium]